MPKVSMEKKYRTREGLEVKLLGVDFQRPYSVVGEVIQPVGQERKIALWTDEGFYHLTEEESRHDLIEVETLEIPEGYTPWYGGKYSIIDTHHELALIEVTVPKYRPFANAKEYSPHFGRRLQRLDGAVGEFIATGYDDIGIYIGGGDRNDYKSYFLNGLRFADGDKEPFGVRVE